MKTIAIGDIHLRTKKADTILAFEKHDRAIFINDLFDTHGDIADSVENNRNAAVWMKEKLKDEKNIFLWSNHVQSYGYDFNPNMYCSGFSREKSRAIWEVLTRDDFNKLKLYHAEQGVLFTHAGLSEKLLIERRIPFENISQYNEDNIIETIEQAIKWLETKWKRAKPAIENGGSHWIMGVGYNRGGDQPIGGVTWEDFRYIVPTTFPQIIGHTTCSGPCFLVREKNQKINKFLAKDKQAKEIKTNNWILDIDTGLNDYIILEDGLLTVKHIEWNHNEILTSNIIFQERIII